MLKESPPLVLLLFVISVVYIKLILLFIELAETLLIEAEFIDATFFFL